MSLSKNSEIVCSTTIRYTIEILELSAEIPRNKEEEFDKWIKNQFIKQGINEHTEYFAIDDNYENDIKVRFFIKLIK